jgi:type VI secretion system protein VasG
VDHIITGTLLPEMSRELLGRMASGEATGQLRVTVEPDGRFGYAFS